MSIVDSQPTVPYLPMTAGEPRHQPRFQPLCNAGGETDVRRDKWWQSRRIPKKRIPSAGSKVNRFPPGSTKSECRSITFGTNIRGDIFTRNKMKDAPAFGRAEDTLKRLKGITWAIPSRIPRPGKRISEDSQDIITDRHRGRQPGMLNSKGQ